MSDIAEKFEEFKVQTMDQLIQLKDVIFQKKKGEALERASTPRDEHEASSLGYFEAETNMAANALKSIEKDINELCGLTDNSLSEFADNFLRGTGSRKAKRLEMIEKTLSNVKPDVNMGMTNYRPTPEHANINDRLQTNDDRLQ